MNLTAVGILAVVFLLIMVRRVGKFRLPIWGIMTAGALAALLFQTISISSAISAVQLDVIAFLFGMFVFGAALDKSGLLHSVVLRGFTKAKNKRQVMLIFMITTAAAAALFMNDTVAVIGAPLAMFCAAKFGIPVVRMLLALCFAVTFGSAATPIGNPQNLLIALSGVPDAFVTFAIYLVVPSVLCLFISYKFLARGISSEAVVMDKSDDVFDDRLSSICKISFVLILLAVAARIVGSFFGYEVSFIWIAAAGALPLLLFSSKRLELLKSVDYCTLIFFVSMFILMEAVWESGVLQVLLPESLTVSIPVMVTAGAVVSQFVSNVPFVLMVLPLLETAAASVPLYMAASAGCTAAGALTILGAASTIIIIQRAEKEGESLSFLTFLKSGIPITLAAVVIYSVWIWVVGIL
ncbi:MAG TPA: SLC13 family permease [Methanocorpusculum sp.]|nr:SLC13 family permease [Methanocorpusculum sp.]HJJ70028.1 SLC13 family permease [Methanocorpusculum sp.]HJJ76127.1 SLC13 family permease [Methanocorpusculum sp.]